MATRCWALNQDGQRCELPAVHMDDPTSLHEISQTWSDDECYVPGMTVVAPTIVRIGQAAMTEHLVAVPKPSGKCVICSHKMHAGPCTAMDGEFDCDCAAGIEE